MKVVVLMGGSSSEREVSLSSGKNIAEALKQVGHEVISIDTVLPVEQLQETIIPREQDIQNGDKNIVHLLTDPVIKSADFVFSALHGGSGENGVVQGVLQMLGYRFNGSGAEGCAIAMDKVISKMIFEKNDIPTPHWLYFEKNNGLNVAEIRNRIINSFQFPFVIKPGHEGSTFGLSIVQEPNQIDTAIDKALKYDSVFLAEEFIPGRELTVAVLGDKALPVVEIRPKHGVYDYECKYTSGMSEYIVPADIDPELTLRIQELTINAFKLLRCSGYGRMDLLLSKNNEPYFLEMNTLPGMTSTSLVPKAAKAAGLRFNDLISEIIRIGMSEHVLFK